MTSTQPISIPLATLSETIEEGLELAFRRVRPANSFDALLTSLHSCNADLEELNDLCEEALLHQAPLSEEDRPKIIAVHRAFNSVLRLDRRGSRIHLSRLLDEVDPPTDPA